NAETRVGARREPPKSAAAKSSDNSSIGPPVGRRRGRWILHCSSCRQRRGGAMFHSPGAGWFQQRHIRRRRSKRGASPIGARPGPTRGCMPKPHVVVVGGGFGGLAVAKALKRAPVQVTVVDRSNHHLFQPLLYQVATSMLSPAHIASPVRALFRRQKNATVLLGEITGVDTADRCVQVESAGRRSISYDYLVIATGVQHSYFGRDEFAPFAPGLKTLADAVAVRNKILAAFELAETEDDPRRHQDLLTFVLVGGGPTGVEMAGAIASLIRNTLASEFRRIDPRSARVVLVDLAPRILGAFDEQLTKAAHERLTGLGVEI